MRRIVVLVSTGLLLLAFAAPVSAAPPIRDSGTVQQASAFASSCTQQGGNTLCTDVFIDAFAFEDEFSNVCVQMFTFVIRQNGQGRLVSDESGCGSPSSFTVAADASSAELTPTEIQLVSCDQRGCTEGGVVTVAASWEAISDPVPFSARSTFRDGTCTFRQTSTGVRAEASSSFSIDDASYAGEGLLSVEEFTVTERCR